SRRGRKKHSSRLGLYAPCLELGPKLPHASHRLDSRRSVSYWINVGINPCVRSSARGCTGFESWRGGLTTNQGWPIGNLRASATRPRSTRIRMTAHFLSEPCTDSFATWRGISGRRDWPPDLVR